MEIGKYNELIYVRTATPGAYLEDEEGNEVLLPTKYIPVEAREGDTLKVFVYKDNEGRPICTTREPNLERDCFGFLEVKDVTDYGAFLDWGIEKDLLVPYREQREPLEKGLFYLVYLYMDPDSERLVASTRTNRFLDTVAHGELWEEQKVDVIIADETDLGFNVIVNEQYKGLVYANEIFKVIDTGDKLDGWVKKVREDGKLDISLNPVGTRGIEPNSQMVLEKIKEYDGFLPLHDKSDPDEIAGVMGMSKKAFKKAIGSLYKQRIIDIKPDGCQLL